MAIRLAAQSLGVRTNGRDNNLNLIRFVAACAVLASHCYPLSGGPTHLDPLFNAIGYSVGDVAVDVFFVTSGFLVTGSLLSRRDVFEFTLSRVLRIFPALIAVILLTIIAAGVASRVHGFYWNSQTLRYLVQNSIMVFGASYELPGVFASNPWPHAVNGALWTLPWELRMYAGLAALWVAMSAFSARRTQMVQVAVVWVALGSAVLLLLPHAVHAFPTSTGSFRFIPTFFAGGAFYVKRDKIRLSTAVFLVFAAALLFGLLRLPVLYYLALPYVTLYLAYVPRGLALRFNKVGDYSYGIYICAYPVQQAIAAALPGIAPAGMFALAFPISFALACCSWHFLESRALKWKIRRSANIHLPHGFAAEVGRPS